MEHIHLIVRVLCVLVILLTLGDIFSTNRALRKPGVHEANPLMALFMRLLGPAWVIPRIIMSLGIVASTVVFNDNLRGAIALTLNCLLLIYVVRSNWKLGNV